MLKTRAATEADIDAIVGILEYTVRDFAATGINMWQNGYPNRDIITRDVKNGISFIAEDEGEVAGFMTIITSEEEFQSTIDTHWNGKNCTVMHRLLVAPAKRNTGVGTTLMELWEQFSRGQGFDSMRTETDATNIPMRNLLGKCGLKEIGILKFDSSDKLAIEKVL